MARQVMWLGFALRLAVTFWNAYYGPSYGAAGDAADFHLVAVEYSQNLQMDRFVFGLMYWSALGTIYHFTIPSLFFGGLLSDLAWLSSAYTLFAIMRLLAFGRMQQIKVMLVYALLPSAVLWTSVTMREAFQLLFVNLAVYAALRIYFHKSKKYWVLLFLAAAAGGVLQPGMLGFGVFIVVAASGWVLFRRRRTLPIGKLLLVVPFAGLVVWYGFSMFMGFYQGFGLDEGLGAAIESYQRGGLSIEARTHYKTGVSIQGALDLLLFVPGALFQYLFEPMPWRPLAFVDVPTIVENMLRAILIWKTLVGLAAMTRYGRIPVLLVFASYLVLETIFAVGTINWGTAARHHIPGMGLLLVTGFARSRRRVKKEVGADPPSEGLLPAAASA